MRDGFESYRAELDGLRLTEESRERPVSYTHLRAHETDS